MLENEIKNSVNQETHYEIKSDYLNDLNQKLDKNKSKKKKLFYLFLTGAIILLITPIAIYFNNLNSNTNSQTKIYNSKSKDILLPKNKDLKENLEKINTTEITNSIKKEVTIENQKKSQIINYKKRNKSISKKKINSFNKEKKSNGNKFNTKEQTTLNKSIKSNLSLNNIPIKNSIIKEKFETKKHIIEQRINDNSMIKFNEIVLEYLENSILNDSTLSYNNSKDTSVTIPIVASVKKPISVSLLVGSNTSFSILNNSKSIDYSNKRKNEENPITSLTTSILINKKITNNLILSSGFNYSTYGSTNNYSPIIKLKTENRFNNIDTTHLKGIDSAWINTTRSKLYYYNGKTDTITDSVFNLQQVTYLDSSLLKANGKTTFSYIEIPIMLGYYKQLNNWNFGINTGVSIGLLTQKSGYYINQDLQSISIASSQKVIYNYLLSPEISYNFTEKLSLGIQPFFKLGLNNLSISEPIDRKYYSIQLNAKISYQF